MRLAITVLSLVALLAAPAAADTGCKGCCDDQVSGADGRGRDTVCPCCGERGKPEDMGAKCKPVCLCDHHAPQQAPQRTGEVSSVEPETADFSIHRVESSELSKTCVGVNRTPAEVFTPLRV